MSSADWQLVDRVANKLRADQGPTATEVEVAELFVELRSPLLRYLHTLGLSLVDSEDVVQETFICLFHHLRHGKPRDNLRGWVFRVGRNLALKRVIRNRRNPMLASDGTAAINSTGQDPNPEEQAVWNGRRARLLAVVYGLSERDRCCLFLRAEGLRYREIAEALGMSLGAVAASLTRSLSKLNIVDRG